MCLLWSLNCLWNCDTINLGPFKVFTRVFLLDLVCFVYFQQLIRILWLFEFHETHFINFWMGVLVHLTLLGFCNKNFLCMFWQLSTRSEIWILKTQFLEIAWIQRILPIQGCDHMVCHIFCSVLILISCSQCMSKRVFSKMWESATHYKK